MACPTLGLFPLEGDVGNALFLTPLPTGWSSLAITTLAGLNSLLFP